MMTAAFFGSMLCACATLFAINLDPPAAAAAAAASRCATTQLRPFRLRLLCFTVNKKQVLRPAAARLRLRSAAVSGKEAKDTCTVDRGCMHAHPSQAEC